jgi:hypothetical protein
MGWGFIVTLLPARKGRAKIPVIVRPFSTLIPNTKINVSDLKLLLDFIRIW